MSTEPIEHHTAPIEDDGHCVEADVARTTTTTEQRVQWDALHTRLDALRREREAMAYAVVHHMKANQDPATRFPLYALELAQGEAREVLRLDAEMDALHKQVEAHPYTAELRSRRQS